MGGVVLPLLPPPLPLPPPPPLPLPLPLLLLLEAAPLRAALLAAFSRASRPIRARMGGPPKKTHRAAMAATPAIMAAVLVRRVAVGPPLKSTQP